MCHAEGSVFFGFPTDAGKIDSNVFALTYGSQEAVRKIAVLPDIYGLTPFYQAFASWIAARGAEVYLVNPWQPFGELPESTREAAFDRRHKLRDRAFCDQLGQFIESMRIDTIIGFCIGGNFLLELVRRGYTGIACALYPLPWGMPNEDDIDPAFEYMESLQHPVQIFMGRNDPLAGPENIHRLKQVCETNPLLELQLYDASGHGFLGDLDSDDERLRANALEALDQLTRRVFP